MVGAFQEDGRFSLVNIQALFSGTLLHVLWTQHRALGGQRAVVGAVFGALPRLPRRHPAGDQRVPPGGRPRSAACSRSSAACRWRSRSSPRSGSPAWSPRRCATTLGHRHLRLRLAVRAARPDPGLLLLPDPADGDRLPAGARRRPPAVARGGGQPRREHLAVLAPGGRPAAARRRSSAPRCCCSPTRSRPTPRRRCWSARASRSCRCSSGPRSPARSCSAGRTSRFALAFEMVVVVAVVMTLYSLLVRRTSRWLQ